MGGSAKLRVLIAGGGIGGLTAAIALQQAGIEAVVFERASDVRRIQVGGGIVLWSNAMKVLQRLGLGDQLRAEGAAIDGQAFRNSHGARITDWPLRDVIAATGAPSVGITRSGLHPILYGALDPGVVRLGTTVTGFEQDAEGVTVQFADGGSERGDLLVIADGRRSGLREKLLGPLPGFPPYGNYVGWDGVADLKGPAAETKVGYQIFGAGSRFIYYPVGGGRLYWLAIAYIPAGGSNPPEGAQPYLLQRFKGWMEPVEALIEATNPTGINRNDIHGGKPLERWGEGRVTLLGDAAHPLTTILAQGACQAIEDTVVLADSLKGAPDPQTGLRRYEANRLARSSHVMALSTAANSTAAQEKPVPAWLRRQVLKVIFPRKVRKDLDEMLVTGP